MKKYLIVGLGNIGEKYDNTRHNIGFKILDNLAKDQKATFETERFNSLYEILPLTLSSQKYSIAILLLLLDNKFSA